MIKTSRISEQIPTLKNTNLSTRNFKKKLQKNCRPVLKNNQLFSYQNNKNGLKSQNK